MTGLMAIVAALVVGLFGVGPATAASPAPGGPTAVGSVPPEVQAAYDGEFLRDMVAASSGDVGQVRAGTVHQLFSFTTAFQEGESTAEPVEAHQGWIAGVEADGVPIGWQRTYLDGGAVRSAGWNPDPESAQAFLSTTAGALVEVPWDAAFFTLVDGVVTPVKISQWDAGLGSRSLAQVQADFAVSRAGTEAAYACCRPSDGCAGGGAAAAGGAGTSAADCPSRLPSPGVLVFAGVAVALGVGVGWTAVRQGRSRRRGGAPAGWAT